MQDQGGCLCSVLTIVTALTACGGTTRQNAVDADVGDAGGVPDVEMVDAISPDAPVPKLDFAAIGKPTRLGGPFVFPEGPVWSEANQQLFLTDVDGDTIYRFRSPSTFEKVLTDSGLANGLALDPSGALVVAGYAMRNVWKTDGTNGTLVVDNFNGKKLNSPDDLTVRSDGTIYFTDPTYGIDGTSGPVAQAELDFMGVFRVAPDGALALEDATTSAPNGVSLSPDERTLFVSYTTLGEIAAFDIAEDGSLSNKRTFASNVAIADGMTIDRGGNLYVAALDGVVVIDPNGERLGTIALPQWATNCAFGETNQRTLFITARNLVGAKGGSLYRIDDMPIAGVPGQP